MHHVNENAIQALDYLLCQLQLKHTNKPLDDLKIHPAYPDISSLREVLNELNVDNLVVRLSINQLLEIPVPAIAHINKKGGHFVVLTKVGETTLQYYDHEYGQIVEPIVEFERKWSGVALLVEKTEKSGEQNYNQNRRQELFENVSKNLMLTLGAAILLVALPFLTYETAPHLLYCTTGVFVSVLLLQRQFGISSTLADSFCNAGKGGNCDEIINTDVSRLFGIIHLAEVCTWYFTSSALATLVGIFTNMQMLPIFFLISILALPAALVSLYYQGFVIRKWCPLCLAIVALLILDFATHILTGTSLKTNLNAYLLTFVSFSAPLMVWLTVRKNFIDSFRLEGLEKGLARFTRSEKIFQHLLREKIVVDREVFPVEVSNIAEDASLDLILVSNPTCTPCARTHALVEQMQNQFGGKVNVFYRFLVNPRATHSVPKQMISHLFSLMSLQEGQRAKEALDDWYKQGKNNIKEWQKRFPLPSAFVDSVSVDSLLEAHVQWCAQARIQKTPTIFIDGQELPDEYSIDDLPYQVSRLLEGTMMSETVS